MWLWERRVALWKLSHVVARWDAMLHGQATSHTLVYLLPLASAFVFSETFFPCHFCRVCCLWTVHDLSVSLHFVVQWVCSWGEMDVDCVGLGSAWLSILWFETNYCGTGKKKKMNLVSYMGDLWIKMIYLIETIFPCELNWQIVLLRMFQIFRIFFRRIQLLLVYERRALLRVEWRLLCKFGCTPIFRSSTVSRVLVAQWEVLCCPKRKDDIRVGIIFSSMWPLQWVQHEVQCKEMDCGFIGAVWV
jgi:hypothetical protein